MYINNQLIYHGTKYNCYNNLHGIANSISQWLGRSNMVLHGGRCIFVCWFDRRCTNNKLTINYLLFVITDKKC